THVCRACGKPLQSRTKREKIYCGATCRKRAERGQAAPSPDRGRRLSRDEAVSRLAYAIKTEEGLRAGLDALSRIIADEQMACRVMPEYARREIAGRIVGAFGLKLEGSASA